MQLRGYIVFKMEQIGNLYEHQEFLQIIFMIIEAHSLDIELCTLYYFYKCTSYFLEKIDRCNELYINDDWRQIQI